MSTARNFPYSNGRSFTSNTNLTWGHGIMSLTCLFTPNGGLQNPVTGDPISGGIYGPLAEPVTGALIRGLEYTGRGFGYGFVYPVARENWAMAATANVRPSEAVSGFRALPLPYGAGAFQRRLAQRAGLHNALAAAAPRGGTWNTLGATIGMRAGSWTLQGGLAAQPEGASSLTGTRAFRAPATLSTSLLVAYGRELAWGLSASLQADHWRTLATRGRSLWEAATLREFLLTAVLISRAGRHEFALQAAWRSGLSGSLDVSRRSWTLAPWPERSVWRIWRHVP